MKQLTLKFWLLLCVLFAGSSAFAEDFTLTVCNGDATDQYVPIYGYYWDTGAMSQFIYPAADLADMAGKQIKTVTFYCSQNISFSSGTVSLKMGVVEQATYESNAAITGLETVCATASPSFDGDKWVFTLDSPFSYNGGNLAVECTLESAGTNCPRLTFLGEAQTENTCCYAYGRTLNSKSLGKFLPKATFTYGELADYEASVSTDALDFGSKATGSSSELSVTVRNTGKNAFTPVVSGLAAPFSTTYESAALAAGETATIPVAFNPTTADTFEATMTINCGDAGSFEVAISGVSENKTTIADGTTTNMYLPIYGNYMDEVGTATQMIYPADNFTAISGKAIEKLTFYSNTASKSFGNAVVRVSMGTDSENTAFASSSADAMYTGLTTVYEGSVAVANNLMEITLDTPFTYDGGNLVIATEVLTGGDYNSISFYGVSTNENTALYHYRTNYYTQRFLPKLTIAYGEPSAFHASVTPAQLNFGTLVTGENAELNVTVKNTGLTAFTPSISGLEAPFSCATAMSELAAGEELTLKVKFAPTAGGEFTGTLTVDCGEAGTHDVALSGKGLALPTGYVEDFNGITDDAKLPLGWKSLETSVSNISNNRDCEIAGLVEGDQYYTILTDGDNKALAFDRASFQKDYVYTAYYLLTPVINGNVVIRAKYTSTYQMAVKVYPIVDGVVKGTEAINVTWDPALSTSEWSYGSFNMAEQGQVAIAFAYGAIDMLAADEMVAAADIQLKSLADVPEEVVANDAGVATINMNAVVRNSGTLDIEDDTYTIQVYDLTNDDMNVLSTVSGVALEAGETANIPLQFDYAPENIQPTQTAKFLVVLSMNGTMKSLTTGNITVRALVPLAKLYKADGTTAYASTDLGVFRGERTLTIQLGNSGTAPMTWTLTPAEGITADVASGTIDADSKQAITLTVAADGTYEGNLATIATNASDLEVPGRADAL